jgi:predicted TPR repeat methyltransferase
MTTIAIPTDPFTQRLQKIANLIASGDLTKAATALNAALKQSPKDPRVFLQGARLAEASGNGKGALELARRAVALFPSWSVSVTELASLLSRQKQFPDAVQVAQQALSLDASNPEVLARAVDIAHQAQRLDLAVEWLTRLDVLAPGNAGNNLLLARDLRALGKTAEAAAVYGALIAANPGENNARLGLAQMAWAQGDLVTALNACDALLTADPQNEVFVFWHQLAQGQTPATLPAAMVLDMHDADADQYDVKMVRHLKYQLPMQMAAMVKARFPEGAFNLLDLGCGTGLLGVALGAFDGVLVGVDLSLKMIEQAARHNCYARFHAVNVLDALANTPDGLYDVLTASDVFSYVGDLTEAIPHAVRILRAGGYLMFSCEVAAEDGPDLVLQPSLRYAHKRSHIEALCQSAGCDEVSVEPVALFLEGQDMVAGFTVVAHKAVATKPAARKSAPRKTAASKAAAGKAESAS